jgi:hypothetical protein
MTFSKTFEKEVSNEIGLIWGSYNNASIIFKEHNFSIIICYLGLIININKKN